MISEYSNLLMRVFWHRLSYVGIILAIGTPLNIYGLYRAKRKYANQKSGRRWQRIRDYENVERNTIHRMMLGLVGVILAIIFWITPPAFDAFGGRIIMTNSVYSRSDIDLRTGVPNIGESQSQETMDNPTQVRFDTACDEIFGGRKKEIV